MSNTNNITDEDLDQLLDELLNGIDLEDEESEVEELDPEAAVEKQVLELVEKHGCSPEQGLEWLLQSVETQGQVTERQRAENEELLALCDGPFRVLRDDTFIDPERLLVWDRKAEPVVQALTFDEATDRYQCGGRESLWSRGDLDIIKTEKRKCLGETLESYADLENPSSTGILMCATTCLIVSNNPLVPHRWCVVKARPLESVANPWKK
jgi:hypothetical protein